MKRKACCGIPVSLQRGSQAQIEAPGDAEYFVQYVREDLAKRYGAAAVFGGGLQVTTSLDLGYQAAAEHAIESHLPSPQDPGAALVAIEPSTGHVLAMAGGKDFSVSQLNLATFKGGTGRQAGSSFKAFTLAAAMKQGFDLDSRWYGPNTITIDDPDLQRTGRTLAAGERGGWRQQLHAPVGDRPFGQHRFRAVGGGGRSRFGRGHGPRPRDPVRPAGGLCRSPSGASP